MENEDGQKGVRQVYEIGYLVLPSIPEDKLPETLALLRKAIAAGDGLEIDAEEPFLHPLSYPMTKTAGAVRYVLDDAYLGWIKFEAEAGNVAAIKAEVEKIGEVLRFILVKAPRKTNFTFAQARAAAAEKLAPAEPVAAEEVVVES